MGGALWPFGGWFAELGPSSTFQSFMPPSLLQPMCSIWNAVSLSAVSSAMRYSGQAARGVSGGPVTVPA